MLTFDIIAFARNDDIAPVVLEGEEAILVHFAPVPGREPAALDRGIGHFGLVPVSSRDRGAPDLNFTGLTGQIDATMRPDVRLPEANGDTRA